MFTVTDNDISIVRGDTGVFKIAVTDSEGEAVTLEDDDVLTFSVRQTPEDEEMLLTKDFDGDTLRIESADTEGMEFGKYKYDVQLKRANGYVDTIIQPHTFKVLEEITYE